MGIIKVLPEATANRIAAGEVIERPASIVKELIENSLDAGAKSIEIAIRHGGKSLIRAADDGSGMTADDAELAFQRHATSKIADARDLDALCSYGFRGEALPSIAAVSRTRLSTRVENSPAGTEILIEGGKINSVKETPCTKGTIVEVRDLFFNTPARRKFLKSDTTEMGHVSDMIANLALSRLDVRFLFKSNDAVMFDLLPTENIQTRAAGVLGGETAKHLLEIGGEEGRIRIAGLIGKPHASRANRAGQSFFVNRRWVKAFPFSCALQAGYEGLLMHNQFPVAVLFIELDPARVDVNVHPTKREVRVSNEPQVKSLIKSLAAARLASESDLAPRMRVPIFSEIASSPAAPRNDKEVVIASEAKQSRSSFIDGTVPFYSAEGGQVLAESVSIRNNLHITKILGQIHGTFILAETEEGFLILDQHAAHERIMFEALLKNFESGRPASQKLLMDEILEISPRQLEILNESLPLLERLGFELAEFGKSSILIRSVPAALDDENPVQLLKNFLDEKEEGKLGSDLENHPKELAALIACKRQSVRARDPLDFLKIKALFEQLAACENPFSCPHGRPAFLQHTFSDLERQFKRKL